MRVHFAFGKTGLDLDLPEGYDYRLLEARSAVPLEDETAAIRRALDGPIGSPPLVDLARGKSGAAISVCDITRPAPNRVVLPPLLERLHQAGIPRDNVTILIATGLHRPATKPEIDEIVGRDIATDYRVVNHNARELSEHRHLGATASGTPVYVDERFVSADLRITLGFVEPHLMLGYSGGRKLVAPGLAAQETIKVLHSPRFMREPRATEGSIDDNPLHRELLEIARMARHDFLIDVALAPGSTAAGTRRIAAVFAGDPVAAHRRAVDTVSKIMLQNLDAPVDAAITTAAGYPLDLTFYQAVKGVTAAAHIVKPGGRILLLAECREGAGADEFSRMLARHGSDTDFLDRIEKAPVIVDQWQLEKLALVTSKFEVLFYVPGLPLEYRGALWGKSYDAPAEAVRAVLRGLERGPKNDARVALIPEGPYVLARAGAEERKLQLTSR